MNKKLYTYEVRVLEKYYVEVEAVDGKQADDKIYEMSYDEMKDEAVAKQSNYDVSIDLVKAEPIEEDKEND